MADQVIKNDGTKESFNPQKIKDSVASATDQAGLSGEEKDKVVEEISASVINMAEQKDIIKTSEIRQKILGDLDEKYPSVSKAWREYDEAEKE